MAINQNVADLQQIISQAEQRILRLENQMYLDAESLLNKLQCVAQNIATVQIQELVGNAVAELKAADPSITFLGIKIINLRLKQVQITDPDQAYASVRDAYLKRLNSVQPTDPAYAVVSTFANIERLAEEASCAYTDPTVAAAFLREEFNYRRLAGAWAV